MILLLAVLVLAGGAMVLIWVLVTHRPEAFRPVTVAAEQAEQSIQDAYDEGAKLASLLNAGRPFVRRFEQDRFNAWLSSFHLQYRNDVLLFRDVAAMMVLFGQDRITVMFDWRGRSVATVISIELSVRPVDGDHRLLSVDAVRAGAMPVPRAVLLRRLLRDAGQRHRSEDEADLLVLPETIDGWGRFALRLVADAASGRAVPNVCKLNGRRFRIERLTVRPGRLTVAVRPLAD